MNRAAGYLCIGTILSLIGAYYSLTGYFMDPSCWYDRFFVHLPLAAISARNFLSLTAYWLPEFSGGLSFVTGGSCQSFSPLLIIHHWLPVHTLLALSFVLAALIGAAYFFRLATALGIPPLCALAGTAIYLVQPCLGLDGFYSAFFLAPAVWYFRAGVMRSNWFAVVVGAAIIPAASFLHDGPILTPFFFMCFGLLAVFLPPTWRRRARSALGLILALLLYMLIVAPLFYPLWRATRESSRLSPVAVAAAPAAADPANYFAQMHYLRNLARNLILDEPPLVVWFLILAGLIGTVWALARRQLPAALRPFAWSGALFIAMYLALDLRVPGTGLLRIMLQTIDVGYGFIVLDLLLALFTAYGINVLFCHPAFRPQPLRRMLIAVSLAVIGIELAMRIPEQLAVWAQGKIGYTNGLMLLAALPVLVGLLDLGGQKRIYRLSPRLLALVFGCSLLYLGVYPYLVRRVTPHDTFIRMDSRIDELIVAHRDRFRDRYLVAEDEDYYNACYGYYYGETLAAFRQAAQIHNYWGLLPRRLARYFSAQTGVGTERNPVHRLAVARVDHPLVQLTGYRYLIRERPDLVSGRELSSLAAAREHGRAERRQFVEENRANRVYRRVDAVDPPAGLPGLRRLLLTDRMELYENPRPFPRVFKVSRCRYYPEPELWAALASVPDAAVFAETAFTDDPRLGNRDFVAPGDSLAVTVTAYENLRCVMQMKAGTPGLVVFTDNYSPDWHCWIDGAEVPLYCVNGVYRGFILPAGFHEVQFSFAPDWLRPCWRLSLLGALLVMVIGLGQAAATAFRRPRRRAFN